MTYSEFIQSIINSRGQWDDNVRLSERGCERHHILPKCMGGEPKDKKKLGYKHHENIIWLYPSEHFTAHKLLAEENPDNYQLQLALSSMIKSSDDNKREFSSEDYELCRIANRKASEIYWSTDAESKSKERSEKIKQGLSKRTDEEIELWKQRKSESQKKVRAEETEEQRVHRQNTRLNTWYNKSEEERKLIKQKEINTKKNRSEEEKLVIHNKFSEAQKKYYDNLTEEEKEKIRERNKLNGQKQVGKKLYYNINNPSEKHRYFPGNEPEGYIWVKEK